jgi:hypothetical protein
MAGTTKIELMEVMPYVCKDLVRFDKFREIYYQNMKEIIRGDRS